jgi:PAS domain-containing protein
MHLDLPAPAGTPAPQQEINLLIADVATLTGIPAPQLRSWEQAGLLHPRRSPNAVRVYGVEDVARARLIKRSLVNPGRRGSLSRLAAQLQRGELRPAPEDYAGLVNAAAGPVPLPDSLFWQAVVDAVTDLVVVCDSCGRLSYANAALRDLLPPAAHADPSKRPDRSAAGDPLPAALAPLPLRWAASTGTHHHDLPLTVTLPGGGALKTLWTVTPLRGADGQLHGAVGVGHAVLDALSDQQQDGLAGAAHDLRGSLTTILGRLQLARAAVAALLSTQGESAAPEDAMGSLDRHVGIAELGALELIRTMETLLDASAANAGMLAQHLEAEPVRLDLLVREAVERAQQRTSHHQLTLEYEGAPLGSPAMRCACANCLTTCWPTR